MNYYHLIEYIGYACLAYFICHLIHSIYNIIYPYVLAQPIKDLVKFSGGKWAVVTGATDGIGKAYAIELAKRGFNVALISRTLSKLNNVKAEIEGMAPNCEVITLVFDFTDADVDHYEQKIGKRLNDLEIGILVNNVGMSHEYPERLTQIFGGLSRLADITLINTLPVILMTAMLLPQMVQRKKGIVINISSGATYHPLALWAAYSSSKKFVDWLTSILRMEYDYSGVIFQTVKPMLVATNMSQIRKTSWIAPAPDYFARCALNTIAIMRVTNGCLSHQIQGELAQWMPTVLMKRMLMQQSITLRDRAVRKRQRDLVKQK